MLNNISNITNNNNNNSNINKIISQIKLIIEKNKTNIFTLEGNIGTGKSTILDQLELEYGNKIVIYRESIKKWEPYLYKYYNEPTSENCKQLQIIVNQGFKEIQQNITKDYSFSKIYFIERSAHSPFHVFIQSAAENNLFTDKDYCELQKQYNQDFEYSNFWNQQCQYIFLNTLDSSELIKRIQKRNKITGDDKITVEYLDKLNYYYQKFYTHLLLDKKVDIIKLDN